MECPHGSVFSRFLEYIVPRFWNSFQFSGILIRYGLCFLRLCQMLGNRLLWHSFCLGLCQMPGNRLLWHKLCMRLCQMLVFRADWHNFSCSCVKCSKIKAFDTSFLMVLVSNRLLCGYLTHKLCQMRCVNTIWHKFRGKTCVKPLQKKKIDTKSWNFVSIVCYLGFLTQAAVIFKLIPASLPVRSKRIRASAKSLSIILKGSS